MNVHVPNQVWQHPWLLAHRVHLHEALKKAATAVEGKGWPAELHTSSKVVEVNANNSSISLEDGRSFQGDVVIGADGVHSATRKAVVGGGFKHFGSGKSAFRFLISRRIAQDDPLTSKYAQKSGELIIWYAEDRRIVMYPTSSNELLNFVCIHPDHESETGNETWDTSGNREKLVKIYEKFDPAILALLKKADRDLKVWKLLDMEPLPSWVRIF